MYYQMVILQPQLPVQLQILYHIMQIFPIMRYGVLCTEIKITYVNQLINELIDKLTLTGAL